MLVCCLFACADTGENLANMHAMQIYFPLIKINRHNFLFDTNI
jgi:hypothetical protein